MNNFPRQKTILIPEPYDRSGFCRSLGKLCELWEGLLALRLAKIADILQDECSSPYSDVFAKSWSLFSSLRGQQLRRALCQPSLQQWVGEAEYLVSINAHRQYPEHLGPVLSRFSALMMNIASLFPSDSGSGSAVLMGSQALPLFLDKTFLRSATVRAYGVEWEWRDGALKISGVKDGRSMKINPEKKGGLPEGYRLEVSRPLGNLAVFTRPPCIEHAGLRSLPDFYDNVKHSFERLPDTVKASIESMITAIAPVCPLHTREATGLLFLDAAPAPVHLIEAFVRDLTTRMNYVYAFQTGASLWRDSGFESFPDMVRQLAVEFAWFDILADGADDLVLCRVLDACLAASRLPNQQDRPAEAGTVLDLAPVCKAAGIKLENPGQWRQQKCRSGAANQVVQWDLLDAIGRLNPEEQRALQAALNNWKSSEASGFGLACCSYIAGDFTTSLHHLLDCLGEDGACEEYWFLAAFCCRQLQHYELFDRVVFREERDRAAFEQIAREIPCR
jgi:hypothetical protein